MPQVARTLVDCPHCGQKQVWIRHVPFCKENPDRRNKQERRLVCPRCRERPKETPSGYCKPCANAKQREDPKTNEYVRDYRRRRLEHDRSKVFAIYDNRCACCGETEEVFLTLDHVNDDGPVDRKAGKDTLKLYREIIVGGRQGDFRLMCINCNRGRWVCGECPHVLRARGEVPVRIGYLSRRKPATAAAETGNPGLYHPLAPR